MMTPKLTKTKDGFEQQFGTNHLGHFLLTELLLDKLKESSPSRVVNVSSFAQYLMAPAEGIPFDNLNAEKSYNPNTQYGVSKLANVLHASELNRRNQASVVTAYSVHPGGVLETPLARISMPSWMRSSAIFAAKAIGLKSIQQGAATQVYCAFSPDAISGEYYDDCNVQKYWVHPKAKDEESGKRLYEESKKMVGL